MNKLKYVLLLILGLFIIAMGFMYEKAELGLYIGGILIALFLLFIIAEINAEKDSFSGRNQTNSEPTIQEPTLQEPTIQEPKYFVNVSQANGSRTIGAYYRNHGYYEDVALIRKDAKWFVQHTAMWPAYQGASNGTQYECELSEAFFQKNGIETVKQLLEYFLRDNTKSCITMVMKEADLLFLLSRIIETKGKYVPESENPTHKPNS